ncbi:lysozyme [Caudoviricetes sp.]|nr:lysozyme [Caudoviricetes sp.]
MQINRYTREVMTQRAVAQTYDSNAVARAGQYADTVANISGQIATKMNETTDNMWLNEALIKRKKAAIDSSYAERNNFVDNPYGYSSYMEKKYTEYDDEIIKTAPNERVKQAYKTQAMQDNLSLYNTNKAWEFEARVKDFDRRYKESTKDVQDMAYSMGANGDEIDPDLFTNTDALTVGAKDLYSPEQLLYMNEASKKELHDKYIQGLITKDPQKAIKKLQRDYTAIPQNATFDDAVNSVLDFEGGYVENDAGKGATMYGVNSAANPEEFKKIMELEQAGKSTEAQQVAKDTYKTKYWDAIGADKLDPQLAYVAMDTAVNQGVGAAKEMLQQSGGDIYKFLDARRSRYQSLAESNPEKAQYLKGWLNRVDQLEARLSGGLIPAERQTELETVAFKQIEVNRSRQEAAIKESRNLDESRIDLAMAQMDNLQSAVTISDSIDEMQSIYGEAWANGYREKLVKASDEFVKKNQNIAAGSAFASGDATYNPSNPDHKKALDDYYDAFMASPQVSQMQPQERNIAITNMVVKSGGVPTKLKGDIQAASVSQDVNMVTNAADLIDRVSISNPHMVKQLGDESSLRRIDMINDRINAGYQPEQAMKTVDEILDPRNAPLKEQVDADISALLKSNKTYFSDKVDKYMSPWFATIDSTPMAKDSLLMATAEYRVRWEDVYRKTRDAAQADKEAARLMTDWSITGVNPSRALMKYAPENYYQIENQDSDWIRKQAINDVMDMNKDLWVKYSREDLKDNLYIVSDPSITPRMAANGKPTYSLILMKDDTPIVLSKGNWMPDVEKRRKELSSKTIQDQDIKDRSKKSFYLSGRG